MDEGLIYQELTISKVVARIGLDFSGPFMMKNFVGRSEDSIIRVVILKDKSQIHKRPMTKVGILPFANEKLAVT
ncbi:hypothetical protein NPIL_572421 [Nephila pilipes]|uniref:Uncharacterized protein n=1 Tax=Nephila pilipes TaxID=299642 RepID=A0A8X6P2Q5_NEPPI|nr:hypothetical protein NPIL_572421 [Nephila pilipes]